MPAQPRRQAFEQPPAEIDVVPGRPTHARHHLGRRRAHVLDDVPRAVEHRDFGQAAMAPGAIVLSLEAGMHPADTLVDRRVGGEAEPVSDGRREGHVGEARCVRGEHGGARVKGEDRVERAGDRVGVARELHARRIG